MITLPIVNSHSKKFDCVTHWVQHHLDSIILLALLFFHGALGILFVTKNSQPLSWDDSFNVISALYFKKFFISLATLKPQWSLLASGFDSYYGPLTRIIIAFAMLLAGAYEIIIAQLTGTLWFLGLIFSTYFFVKSFSKSSRAGIISSAFISFFPLLYSQARTALYDIPQTTLFTLYLLCILKRTSSKNRSRWIMLSYIFAISMLLIKIQSIIYLFVPLTYISFLEIKKHGFFQFVKNNMVPIVPGFLILVYWVWFQAQKIYEYLTISVGLLVDHPQGFSNIKAWTYLLHILINYVMTPYGFIFFVIGAFLSYSFFDKKKTIFVFLIITTAYLFFSTLSNKDIRFFYPILPLCALLAGIGWDKLLEHKKYTLYGVAILLAYFSAQTVFFSSYTFGVPLKNLGKIQLKVPLIDELVLYKDDENYPVRKLTTSEIWNLQSFTNDLEIYLKNKSTQSQELIFFLPNFEFYNTNNITLELHRRNIQNITLSAGIGKKDVSTAFIDTYMNRFDTYLTTDGIFGPDFQFDKQYYIKAQSWISREHKAGKLTIYKKYPLPNGATIIWMVKKNL